MTSRVTRFPARASGPAERLAGFLAHLRLNGWRLGVGECAAAMAALSAVNPTDPREARLALKAVCAGNAEEVGGFDALFDAYWFNRGRERAGTVPDPAQPARRDRQHRPFVTEALEARRAGRAERPDAESGGAAEADGEGRLVASRRANTMRSDLREFVTQEEIAEAEAIAARLARAIRDRRSRRRKAARRGQSLDLRRIARASVATGGEPIRLFHRRRPDRPANLVLLLDVSGSMTVYARVFLAFLKGVLAADMRADAYLFHTGLVRITDALRDRDSLRAVNRLSLMAQGFGGGTRIGGALAAFNAGYAKARVNGRSVVMILSDGYDTDPPERLAAELARLRRRGCRIVWLNPLKGWRGYAPVARGMAAALPHLDLFAPANTLESLAALEPEFARL
ncbi:carbon monoxide dehydrogenase [Maritimibacter sp. 55A14]|uniref:vWA domain-containing protein n=1 Tax=Maritimibacter sp. 55A14 TaxID=2174844 RepID=UPI000D61C679|nr:VWA domain-containing protein [Maritimibacter sp. 55A14]PWE34233.1 carbon monoxide dehydrogenase [Maritimibacter sp. 55A14]